jgi:exodeoxyribonuclease VII small subunit
MKTTDTGLSFEEAVTRLESIVSAMEDGRLPLDQCLASFEEAIGLSRLCAQQLEQAEARIQELTMTGGLLPMDSARALGISEAPGG